MKRLLAITTIMATSLLAAPAHADHGPWNWHWPGPAPRTIYIDVRDVNLFEPTLHAEWGWQGMSGYGPVINFIDLWGVRADNGYNYTDCTPRSGRIVICLDNPTLQSIGAESLATNQTSSSDGWGPHIDWCVIRMKWQAAHQVEGWTFQGVVTTLQHELGHCMGLAHGGGGIMDSSYINQHDYDQVVYNHYYA